MTEQTDLDKLRAIAKAASPGPYYIERRDDDEGTLTYFLAAFHPALMIGVIDMMQAARAALLSSPPSAPDPESWWYAGHRDDTSWSGGLPSREEAIAEAFHGAEYGEVCYVVRGERPTTEQFAKRITASDVLDELIAYGADNGLLGEDSELTFSDAAACEEELRAVVAKYLVRPHWWCCDGSQAEKVVCIQSGDDPIPREGCPMSNEESEDNSPPGMTVSQLRRALEGVADDLTVTVRAAEEGLTGGITSAGIELDEEGVPHFAINASSDPDDFDF